MTPTPEGLAALTAWSDRLSAAVLRTWPRPVGSRGGPCPNRPRYDAIIEARRPIRAAVVKVARGLGYEACDACERWVDPDVNPVSVQYYTDGEPDVQVCRECCEVSWEDEALDDPGPVLTLLDLEDDQAGIEGR